MPDEKKVYEHLKNDKTQMNNDILLKWPYKDNVFQGSSRTRTSEIVKLNNGGRIELNLSTQLEKKKKVELEENENRVEVDMAWKGTGHYNSDKARKVLKKIYGLESKKEAENRFPDDFSILEFSIGDLYKKKQEDLFLNPNINKEEFRKFCSQKTIKNEKIYSYDEEDEEVKENPEEKVNPKNLLIKGDNVQALISLQENFKEKIKCIYIDPPFNTGGDDFAYNDNWKHSEWLTFMRDRLKLAKELLRQDGAIFVHIDDNEHAYLRILMDEIFGKENFVTSISVKSSTPSGRKTAHSEKTIIKQKDHILVYQKEDQLNFHPLYIKKGEWDTHYRYILDRKNSEVHKLEEVLKERGLLREEDGLEDLDVKDKKVKEFYIQNKNSIFRTQPEMPKKIKEKSRKNKGKIIEYKDNGDKFYAYNGGRVNFLASGIKGLENGEKDIGKLLCDFWGDIDFQNTQNEGGVDFPAGKKPEKLIFRILKLVTEEGDLILDFFAGSGTTGAVAHKMNRNWIMIEQLDYCDTITKQRILNVLKGEKSGISNNAAINWKGGGNFKYIELNEKYEYSEDMFRDEENKELTKKEKVDLHSTFNFYFDVNVEGEKLFELDEGNYRIFLSYGKDKRGRDTLLILKDIDKEDYFEENKEDIAETVDKWLKENADKDFNVVFISGKSFEINKATISEVEYEKIPPYFAQNVIKQVRLP